MSRRAPNIEGGRGRCHVRLAPWDENLSKLADEFICLMYLTPTFRLSHVG